MNKHPELPALSPGAALFDGNSTSPETMVARFNGRSPALPGPMLSTLRYMTIYFQSEINSYSGERTHARPPWLSSSCTRLASAPLLARSRQALSQALWGTTNHVLVCRHWILR